VFFILILAQYASSLHLLFSSAREQVVCIFLFYFALSFLVFFRVELNSQRCWCRLTVEALRHQKNLLPSMAQAYLNLFNFRLSDTMFTCKLCRKQYSSRPSAQRHIRSAADDCHEEARRKGLDNINSYIGEPKIYSPFEAGGVETERKSQEKADANQKVECPRCQRVMPSNRVQQYHNCKSSARWCGVAGPLKAGPKNNVAFLS